MDITPDPVEQIRRMVVSLRKQYAAYGQHADAEVAVADNVLAGIDSGAYRQHLTHEEFVASGEDMTPWVNAPSLRRTKHMPCIVCGADVPDCPLSADRAWCKEHAAD